MGVANKRTKDDVWVWFFRAQGFLLSEIQNGEKGEREKKKPQTH